MTHPNNMSLKGICDWAEQPSQSPGQNPVMPDGREPHINADMVDGMHYTDLKADWEAYANSVGGGVGGPAGGDLAGTYPNPTVAKIQGIAVSTTPPDNGQVLKFNGSVNKWEAANDATGGGSGVGIDQIAYVIPGTYTWTCPAGVTSIKVMVIGAGAYSALAGGGGGGVSINNNLSVTAGKSYTIVVGDSVESVAGTSSFSGNGVNMVGGGGGGSTYPQVVITGGLASGGSLHVSGGEGGQTAPSICNGASGGCGGGGVGASAIMPTTTVVVGGGGAGTYGGGGGGGGANRIHGTNYSGRSGGAGGTYGGAGGNGSTTHTGVGTSGQPGVFGGGQGLSSGGGGGGGYGGGGGGGPVGSRGGSGCVILRGLQREDF